MHCEKARKSVSSAMDGRLDSASLGKLQEHLRLCPACADWQSEQVWLRDLMQVPQTLRPSAGFQAGLSRRIKNGQARPSVFTPFFIRPALLHAAIFLLFVFSALFGIFLGGQLDTAAPGADASLSAFSQALNLETFADLPADSFGAVYERLLQGELR